MVQQSGIETLECDWQLLTEKQTLQVIAGGWADSVTPGTGTDSMLIHWKDPTTQSLLAWKPREVIVIIIIIISKVVRL